MVAQEASKSMETDQTLAEERPEIAKHVVFGINEVTKALERHISRIRQSLLDKASSTEEVEIPIAVFACRWDLNPSSILSHIPHLVASANTLLTILSTKFPERTFPDTKLINLPKGSEASVSEAIGMRRVSIILLTVSHY
jgi:ribonuclease P/MRP protein subunit POP3